MNEEENKSLKIPLPHNRQLYFVFSSKNFNAKYFDFFFTIWVDTIYNFTIFTQNPKSFLKLLIIVMKNSIFNGCILFQLMNLV